MPLPEFTAVYRLAADPQLQVVTLSATQKNVPVLRMRLAASASRLSPSGRWETTARLFIDAELFDRNAVDLHALLAKGSLVAVTGELCTDEWTTTEGDKRSKVKIKARRVYPFAAAPAAPAR